MDGVIYVGDTPLPGVQDALDYLVEHKDDPYEDVSQMFTLLALEMLGCLVID